jgi:osmotically-inducible protein OsmY
MTTDSQLQDEVTAKLNWEPSVDARTVDVQVRDGVVTLSGHVRSYAEQWHAAHAARRVCGVRALTVALKIVLPHVRVRTDLEIACAADHMLRWASDLPDGAIQVTVAGGWITLSGEAGWEYQRQIALSSMRYPDGVTGVSDRIKIRPTARASEFDADRRTPVSCASPGTPSIAALAIDNARALRSASVLDRREREVGRDSRWSVAFAERMSDRATIAK